MSLLKNSKFCHSNEIWKRNGKTIPQNKSHQKFGGLIFEQCLNKCIIAPSTVVAHKNIFYNKISAYDCIISPSALGEAQSGLEYTGSPVLNTTWTLLGMPSITLPMFTSKNNLPIGCQFISKKADDSNLLSISKKILLEFN